LKRGDRDLWLDALRALSTKNLREQKIEKEEITKYLVAWDF
jgi:hypothetical protein